MGTTGQPRSLRALHRFSAFVVALLWCAAPVLAALHASAEAHRYCAEHGTVEDAGQGGTEGGEHANGPAVAVALVAPSESPAAHDGCAFARFCRFGQVLASVILAVTDTVTDAPPSAPALDILAPAVAVIVIAPKTSPPV